MPILCRYLIAVAILPVLGACDLHKNLTETLLGQLSHKLRPVKHPDEKLNVYIQSALYQVVEIWWWDPHLTWEPANFDHVTKTFLHSSEVWMPDLYLYHSVQGSTPFTVKDSAVQVDFQGKVSIFVPFTAQAFCPVNVKHFPFDTQKCSFTFGAWSYTSEAIEYIVVNEEVYLGGFYDNQEWLLTDSSLTPGISNYSTPKHNDTYAFVQMELTLQRQGFYYVFNLVIPSTLVTFVFVVGVHVPIDSSAPPRRSNRFRLAITTLLSMGVMLLMLVEDMPKFAITTIEGQRGSFSSIPLLGLYYISLITLVSVCSITCTVFVKMERYAMKYKEYKCIPKYLRCLAPAPPIEIRSSNYNLSPATRSENGLVTRKTNFQFDNPERTILQEVSQKVNDICHKIEHQIDRTNEHLSKENLPRHWDVLIKRLEKMSLAIYVSLVVIVIIMFLGHDICVTGISLLTKCPKPWLVVTKATTVISTSFHQLTTYHQALSKHQSMAFLCNRIQIALLNGSIVGCLFVSGMLFLLVAYCLRHLLFDPKRNKCPVCKKRNNRFLEENIDPNNQRPPIDMNFIRHGVHQALFKLAQFMTECWSAKAEAHLPAVYYVKKQRNKTLQTLQK